MQCLYCGTSLAILRMLANGTFCSDEHRAMYEKEQAGPPVGKSVLTRPPSPACWRWNTFEKLGIDIPPRCSKEPRTFPKFIAVRRVSWLRSGPPVPLARPEPKTATSCIK